MDAREIERFLEQWQMDAPDLRRRVILSTTPRARGRWHALWLLSQGWTAPATAQARALMFEQTGGPPPPRSARRSKRS